MPTHTLKNGNLKVIINEMGGTIDAFTYGEKQPFNILRPRIQDGTNFAGNSGLFPMLPLVNRVRDNYFNWQDKLVILPIHDDVDPNYFLHGDGWLKKWSCLQNDTQKHNNATLELSMKSDIKEVCCYQAKQVYTLTENALFIKLTITNTGRKPFPFGGGFHPFFTCLPETLIQFSADGVWLEDENHIPNEYLEEIPTYLNFEMEKCLPKAFINNGFYTVNSAEVTLTHQNGLRISMTSPCRYLQVYKPEGECDFFCIEPQSQAVNAHKTISQSEEGQGLVILLPQESLQIEMTIKVDGFDDDLKGARNVR